MSRSARNLPSPRLGAVPRPPRTMQFRQFLKSSAAAAISEAVPADGALESPLLEWIPITPEDDQDQPEPSQVLPRGRICKDKAILVKATVDATGKAPNKDEISVAPRAAADGAGGPWHSAWAGSLKPTATAAGSSSGHPSAAGQARRGRVKARARARAANERAEARGLAPPFPGRPPGGTTPCANEKWLRRAQAFPREAGSPWLPRFLTTTVKNTFIELIEEEDTTVPRRAASEPRTARTSWASPLTKSISTAKEDGGVVATAGDDVIGHYMDKHAAALSKHLVSTVDVVLDNEGAEDADSIAAACRALADGRTIRMRAAVARFAIHCPTPGVCADDALHSDAGAQWSWGEDEQLR